MRSLATGFLILTVAAVAQIGAATVAEDSRDLEDHIWALEDAYVTAYKNADHDSILALMHEQFLGWPDSEEHPTTYQRVPRFLRENYSEPGTWDFKIDRAGIRIGGNVVLTHYALIATANKSETGAQVQVTRITHTWIKEDSGWKILGGMSNER